MWHLMKGRIRTMESAGRTVVFAAAIFALAPHSLAQGGGAAESALMPGSAVVRVNTFPNAKALPLHAGIAGGIFARHGLALRLAFTENSTRQREGLAAGEFDVVHSAVDNAVAMVEVAKKDVVIVTGGDNGMNEFFVQPYVRSFADLRGRKLVVDAPNTAYAILAKKILLKHGLKDGADYEVVPVGRGELRLKAMAQNRDYAAAVLNLPFTIQAEQMGMKTENRAECVAILAEKLKISRDVAARTYQLLVDPTRGFTPDAAFDAEGFRNMLALRAKIETGGSAAPPTEKYVDLSYYRRAMNGLGK